MLNPIIPMIAVTGDPDSTKIKGFLEQMHNVGIQQFLIYPRSGCEVKYMSERWFAVIKDFLETADNLGMKVWLYDDFNWPSGHCGGKVVENPKYRLKSICIRGTEAGKIYSGKNKDDFFGYGRFPDLLSSETTEEFIKNTHEEYYRRYKEYFGKVILGIFTDEPAVAYVCGQNDIPYYDGIKQDYKDKTNRDFDDDLNTEAPEFQMVCMELVNARFKHCYFDKLRNWCSEHGIIMTGHMLHDNSPYQSARTSGGLLKGLSSFEMPGIDEMYTDLMDVSELALMGVAEYARRKNKRQGALAELFSLGPCDMSYAKKRCMLHLVACFKIDHYITAIAPLDVRGCAIIKDFFDCFSPVQPDFEGLKLLAVEAKKAAEYAQKDYDADVLVRYPVSYYTENVLEPKNEQVFYDLLNDLTRRQIQWKYIEENEITDSQVPVISLEDSSLLETYVLKEPLFTCEDGSLPENLFVRRFSDGAILVMDLSGKSRELQYKNNTYYLDAYGILDNEIIDEKSKENVFEVSDCFEQDAEFQITYTHENIIRSMYVNQQTVSQIECADDIKVAFAIRDGVDATLQGRKLECIGDEKDLPVGMGEFYRSTEKQLLKKGIYELISGDDIKYLPSVFVKGAFYAESISGDVCRIRLSSRKEKYYLGESFSHYGKISFSKELYVPEKADCLEIKGTTLFTKVYLNGTLLGERIYSPYRYMIPEDAKGKECKLVIEQFSSIGPVFGDVEYHDQKTEKVSWRGTPSTGVTSFGFDEIKWLF